MQDKHEIYYKKNSAGLLIGGKWCEGAKLTPKYPPLRWALGDGLYLEVPEPIDCDTGLDQAADTRHSQPPRIAR